MPTSLMTMAPAFKKVIALLDGSPVAEDVIGHLQRMVMAVDELVLLHIVPPVPLPIGTNPTVHLKLPSDAEHYLVKIQSNAPRVRTRIRVESGNVVDTIAEVCRDEEADLLAFTTHSKRGLGSVLFGGTARELLRRLQIPMLVSRPGLVRSPLPFKRILMPVGTEPREQSLLEPIRKLARRLNSEVYLMRTTPVIVIQDPVTGFVPSPVLPPRTEESRDSLEVIANALPGVRTRLLTPSGEVTRTILEQAKALQVDLIAMTTHARKGIDRLLSGSFAEEVLRSCDAPVLLQHVEES